MSSPSTQPGSQPGSPIGPQPDTKPTIKVSWMHSFDEDEQTRHHTYMGIALIHIGGQHIIIKRRVVGDDPKGSPPELEQKIVEWCQQMANTLNIAQDIEITADESRWEYGL